jgi:hypothetical protein
MSPEPFVKKGDVWRPVCGWRCRASHHASFAVEVVLVAISRLFWRTVRVSVLVRVRAISTV